MLTSTVLNTIDAGYPSSSMNLSTTHLDSTKYIISWSGEDDYQGSGIRDFTIYYSTDPDSNYSPWHRNITDTSAIFAGAAGETYYFYSIARDGVGYIEEKPQTYDLELYVTMGIGDKTIHKGRGLKIYPNPFTKSTTIEFYNPENHEYKMIIYDLTGKIVYEINGIISNKIKIERGLLQNGVYVVEIIGQHIYRGKLIIN